MIQLSVILITILKDGEETANKTKACSGKEALSQNDGETELSNYTTHLKKKSLLCLAMKSTYSEQATKVPGEYDK